MTQDPASETGVDSRRSVVAAIILSVVGVSAFLILPVLVGAAAIDLVLSERQMGLLAAGLMTGSAVSALLAVFWVRRIDWQKGAYGALLLLSAGLFIAILADGFVPATAALFLASLGGGATYSLALTVLSDNINSDRVFGYSITAQVAFQVIGLLLLPSVVEARGLDALLAVLCLLATASLLFVRWIPRSGKVQVASRIQDVIGQPRVLLAQLGCLMFFFNVGCFWTYIERMGVAEGFTAATIGVSLAAGVSVGMIGSLSAAWLGDRFGRVRALTIAAVGTVVALAMLTRGMSITIFIIGVAIYNFMWNFSLTYQYAIVAAGDETGRSVAVTPAFHALGGAIGPSIAAMYVSSSSFFAVNVLAAIGAMISLILFIPAASQRSTVVNAV